MLFLTISQFHIAAKSVLLLFAFIIAGIFFTLYIYRFTIPPVSLFLKRIMSGLRIIALLLLLFVIFELSVNLIKTRKDKPQVAIAIDTSASMAVKDETGIRAEIIKEVLQNPAFAYLQNNFIMNYYTFSNTTLTHKQADSLFFSGDATNIIQCLQFIKKEFTEKNLAAIIMLSDGNYNRGGNPVRIAEQLGTPVFTVGLGSAEPVKDLAIIEVENNSFCYLDESTPVNVTIRNRGYGEIGLPISLTVNDELIETQMHTLPALSELEATFNVTPKITGINKLVISIPVQKNELIEQNNSRTIYIDVLKSRLYIQIYAGSLSPDISFLKNSILSSKRYSVGLLVEKPGGGFYNYDNDTQDTDIIIFIDFPTAVTDQATLTRLLDAMETNATPLWVITGKNINLKKLSAFENWLPFKCNANYINETQIYAEPGEIGKNHPILQPAMQTSTWISAWLKLPPIYTIHQFQQFWPETQTLVNARTTSSQQNAKTPGSLVVIRTRQMHKSAAILGYGLWRWELLMRGVGDDSDIYNNFINNMLQWLETKKETSAWQIKTDKQHYNFGEPIKVTVNITKQALAMVNEPELTLLLNHKQGQESVTVSRSGDDSYSNVLYLDKAGDYQLTLDSATMSHITNKPDEAVFSIGEYSVELNNTQLQKPTLQDLALNSGGRYVEPDSVALLQKVIHGATRTSAQAWNKELWNEKYILFLIIFLLALEWFLRKKKGML